MSPVPGVWVMRSMSRLCTLVCVFCISVPAQNWQLVWQDEFEYQGLPDSLKWGYEVGYVRNNEAQYYTEARTENAWVDSGRLAITARRDNWNGNEYTSASLTTRGITSWTYGRIEMRAVLAGGRGTWPAFWTLGADIGTVGWPACGEIDIMEYVGFDPLRVYGNIHTEAYNHADGTGKGHSIEIDAPYEQFHTYAIEWYPDRIDFFVDGSRHFTFANEGTGWEAWPYDTPQFIILNLAIGGSWGGQQGIDTTMFPVRMLVDYVRVYQDIPPGPYTLSIATSGSGTVTATPPQTEYDSGAVVSVEAVPETGYVFAGWRGDTAAADNPLSLTMVRDRSLLARFARPGEMVVNGTFDEGLESWTTWVSGESTADADFSVRDGALVVSVAQTGASDWEAQCNQPGIALEQDTTYRLTFQAHGDTTGPLGVRINMSHDPYTTYYYEQVTLGAEPQTYTIEFTLTHPSDPDARVELDFGAFDGTVRVDDVSLVRSGGVSVVPRGHSEQRHGSGTGLGWARVYDLAGRLFSSPAASVRSRNRSAGVLVRWNEKSRCAEACILGSAAFDRALSKQALGAYRRR